MNQNQHTDFRDDEITLKELIQKIREYVSEAFRNIHWIVLFVLPVLAYFLYHHYKTPITYADKITFMVNSDDGNSASSIGSILGQFGLGGGGGRSRQNIDKILELSRTRRIIGEALCDSIEIDGQTDLMMNHIIQIYDLNEKWSENDPEWTEFKFKSSDIASFDLKESMIFKRLYGAVVGNPRKKIEGLLGSGYSEETGIMRLSAKTLSESLSYHLLLSAYDNLSEFYINKSIEKQKTTFDLVSAKKDSIQGVLQQKEYELANFRQSSQNLIDQRSRLKEIRLKNQVFMLSQVYAEAVKNTEISDFTLKNTIPFVQVIDEPMLPIRGESSSILMSIIKGGLIGGILGLLFVWGRKFLREALA